MGISFIVKYLLSWSNVAVVPLLLADTTQAAGLRRNVSELLIYISEKKSLSMNDVIAPPADAYCTGDPNMNPLKSFAFSRHSFTTSSKTHLPFLSQFPQAMHPAMGLIPIQKISVSIPSFSKAFATSLNAV